MVQGLDFVHTEHGDYAGCQDVWGGGGVVGCRDYLTQTGRKTHVEPV